jgi:hypothetical protein
MIERAFRKVIEAVVTVAAFLYFLIDFLFLSALRPFLRWLRNLRIYARLKAAIERLGPYATLALFLVPLIILEPFKPAGMYLMAKGQLVVGIAVIAIGEIIKIGTVEQIFQIGRPKLMTIPAFARAYAFVVGWLAWVKALSAVQAVSRQFREMKQMLIAAIRRIRVRN